MSVCIAKMSHLCGLLQLVERGTCCLLRATLLWCVALVLPGVHVCVLVQVPGLVNVDFADVRTIMAAAGTSLMGQGRCSGKGRAREAALTAISSPLLDIGIERATGIVWNITGPPDLTLFEVRPPFGTHIHCR